METRDKSRGVRVLGCMGERDLLLTCQELKTMHCGIAVILMVMSIVA